MNKWIPITLWIAVAVVGAWVLFGQGAGKKREEMDGRRFVDVPWKHTPTIGDFTLTDQNDQPFRSVDEIGKPMLVYFFFSQCPDICRQLNGQIKVFTDEFRKTDMQFVGMSVDPENDTPEMLKKYQDSFSANTKNWRLLTGEPENLQTLSFHNFRVPWKKFLHTEKLFLIDRWGRIRNWFDWNEPDEIQRLRDDIRKVLAEKQPPMDLVYKTRYAMTGTMAKLWKKQPWIREFELTDQNGKELYSKDLTGKVWIASFFFSTCPSICKEMNQEFSGYQKKLMESGAVLVSISTDGNVDTPSVLKDYRRQFHDGKSDWRFTTAEPELVKRISSEFFKAPAGTGHHSTDLFVVDKWGTLRGRFDWRKAAELQQMWDLVKKLNAEDRPQAGTDMVYPSKPKDAPMIDPDLEEEQG